tara:strand:- start:31 stop:384 length:354 start_codon:yes stop_codon:yes gene_type:complete
LTFTVSAPCALLALATGLERNLHFIRGEITFVSDRLRIAWGGAILMVTILGIFWATDSARGTRAIVWRVVAALSGLTAIVLPFTGLSLSPQVGLWLIAVLGILVVAINPSMKPWGYS